MSFIEIFPDVFVRESTITAFFLVPPSPNATSRFKWRIRVNAMATHESEFDSEDEARQHMTRLSHWLRVSVGK